MKSVYPDAEIVDATDKVILPGFIDAHHTGHSFILRYLTSGQPMARWNRTPSLVHAFEYLGKEASFDDFSTLYRLSFFAAIKSGVTTLAEFGMGTSDHSFPAALEMMKRSNLGGYIGLHNSDQIEAAKNIRDSQVRFAYVIEDEEKLTTYDFEKAVRLARELQWPLIVHLGQTEKSSERIKKNFNKSITQLCSEYGIFDLHVHLIHLACIDENDLDIIAASNIPLVISPSAILRKGTAVPPVEKLNKYKIGIALGTDWGVVQPLENIRAYASILKSAGLPAGSPYNLLAVHTINGARVLRLEKEIGTIETGKRADIVFMDLSDFRNSASLADKDPERILDTVINELGSRHVSDVMINGDFYVRKGQLLTYSEDDLVKEGRRLFEKMVAPDEKKSPSAEVLPFLPPEKGKKKSEGEIDSKEGFKILRREPEYPDPGRKAGSPLHTTSKLPDNVRRIFGDDDV
jgi:5-methylthioadenosine/S-adenosylhomocysteine deaminase